MALKKNDFEIRQNIKLGKYAVTTATYAVILIILNGIDAVPLNHKTKYYNLSNIPTIISALINELYATPQIWQKIPLFIS